MRISLFKGDNEITHSIEDDYNFYAFKLALDALEGVHVMVAGAKSGAKSNSLGIQDKY